MNIKVKTIKTASRLYYVWQDGQRFEASFRPLNPKNGAPWQASRSITEGEDCYQKGKYGEGGKPLLPGPRPSWEVLRAEGMDWSEAGYSSEALAEAVTPRHMAKSKLTEIL